MNRKPAIDCSLMRKISVVLVLLYSLKETVQNYTYSLYILWCLSHMFHDSYHHLFSSLNFNSDWFSSAFLRLLLLQIWLYISSQNYTLKKKIRIRNKESYVNLMFQIECSSFALHCYVATPCREEKQEWSQLTSLHN